MFIRLITLYIIVVSYSYVFSIHVNALHGDRDDPKVMRFRMKRISLVTLINIILAPIILICYLKVVPDVSCLLESLGVVNPLSSSSIVSVLKTLLLFIILFIGPVIKSVVENDLFSQFSSFLQLFRDLLFAPLTEEFFYTSLTTGPFLASKAVSTYSPTQFHDDDSVENILRYTPLLFGFAHLHHAIEMRKKGANIASILIVCGFQCLYTALFGYLTNRIFINTGSLWCCFVAHSFCNLMGFPSLTVEGRLTWRIGYILLLLLGLYGFNKYFTCLTLSL